MNILILTAKCGMGHYTASLSLKQELENSNTHVEVLDFFDLIFPKLKTLIYGSFNFLVTKCSHIYNFFYRFSAHSNFAPFKKIMKKRIEKILNEKNIDIVISTFPVCSQYVSAYKKLNHSNLKLYTYITDIDVNKEWLTSETDAYFVASNETKLQMLHLGISEKQIKVIGIPVRKEFKQNCSAKRKNEIVVMGGGLGLLPYMEQTLKTLSQNPNLHITLLAGKNQKLFDKYHNQFKNMTVVGYTNQVHQYLSKAELIITKAGGITLFEAIHSKTPLYILYPFLSQEIGNAKFIEKNGIGKVVWNKNENAASNILDLLENPQELEFMQKNMQNIQNTLEALTVLDIYQKGA